MYIYPWYISDLTLTGDIEKIIGDKVSKCFYTFKNDFMTGYLEISSFKRVGLGVLKKIAKDKLFFKKIIQKIYEKGDELMIFCDKVNKTNVSKLTDKQILKLYEEYMWKLRTLRAWGWIPVLLDGTEEVSLSKYIMDEFSQFLNGKPQEKEMSRLYSTLSSSEKKSEVQTEELARLNLLLKIKSSPDGEIILGLIKKGEIQEIERKYLLVFRLLKNHTRKFAWLPYQYEGPIMNIDDLVKLLKGNLDQTENIERQKKNLLEHYKEVKIQKNKIIKELGLSSQLIHLFEVSAELMFIKDYRKYFYQSSYVAMDKVIVEIAKRLQMDFKEVKYLVLEEIADALLKNKADYYRSKAKLRLNECCYLATNGTIKVYEGQAMNKILSSQLKDVKKVSEIVSEKQDILKGMVAYSGLVRGTVKIVLTKEDIDKVIEGDILVSSATNPDLITAMKKAAAFVTDTGGIISHAAIVARELKKPCIVGTKIATHVLKDGDIVEVNANEGFVKILK